MFKKILVPTDGSVLSLKAIEGAIDYVKAGGGRLIGISVIEPYPYYMVSEAAAVAASSLAEFAEQFAQENLDAFVKLASSAGVEYETALATDPSPWSAIVQTAEARVCDASFMASHGRKGLDAVLLGSQTQKVLVHTKIPVLVYR